MRQISAPTEVNHYQLRRVWTYAGKRHRLGRGTYRWRLWAGYGHRSERRYGKLLRRRLDPGRRWRIGISHANVPEGAALVRDTLAARLPRAEFLPIIPLGTALGVHGGPGCIVVAAQELR